MANVIGPWVYTDDYARTYITGVNTDISAQDNGGAPAVPLIGGRAATAADAFPPLPSSVKPRRVECRSATKKVRYVILAEPTAPLATLGTVISIEDSDGAASDFTSRKVLPERLGANRV